MGPPCRVDIVPVVIGEPFPNLYQKKKRKEKPKRKKNTYLFPQPPFSFKHPPPALAVQLIRVG